MENIPQMAAEWWLKWLFGILAGALVAGFRYLYKRQKAQEKRQAALEEGVRALLRDNIISAYYHYHERGSITLHGLESAKLMYKAYVGLDGNGTVPGLVDAMSHMEVVDE